MRSNNDANNQHQSSVGAAAHDAIYDLFILGTTIYSLIVIALLFIWPLTLATRTLLLRVDALICVIFAIDFVINFIRSSNWRDYFFSTVGMAEFSGQHTHCCWSPMDRLFASCTSASAGNHTR